MRYIFDDIKTIAAFVFPVLLLLMLIDLFTPENKYEIHLKSGEIITVAYHTSRHCCRDVKPEYLEYYDYPKAFGYSGDKMKKVAFDSVSHITIISEKLLTSAVKGEYMVYKKASD